METGNLIELVREYYDKRGLKWPTFDDAMKFVHTEIAEVYELDLARIGGFVRNHPENKPKFSKIALEEELGDAIFMLIVAGLVEEINPLEAMENKMKRKLKNKENQKKEKPLIDLVPVPDNGRNDKPIVMELDPKTGQYVFKTKED